MSVVALAIISMTIGFVACKKEKDTINEKQNENVERKPIAIVDLTTGQSKCMIDADKIQSKINEQLAEKGQNDRYIIESVEFEQNAFDFEDSTCSALKIVLIDTEKENSITHWLYGGFLESRTNSSEDLYYLKEDILNGNYDFYTNENGSIIKNVIVNNTLASRENEKDDVDDIDKAPYLSWNLTCNTDDNCRSCEKYKVQGKYYCWCNEAIDKNKPARCQASQSNNGTIGLLTLILSALALGVALL